MEYVIIGICILGIYIFGYFWSTKDERNKNKNSN